MTTAFVGLAGLALLFVPLEWAFPARPAQRRWRADLVTDVAFYFGQALVFGAVCVAVLDLFFSPLRAAEALADVRRIFATLPTTVRAVIALLLGDLALYFVHRLQHRSDWLWRFHGVHHTAQELDFVAAHREHPIDGIVTRLVVNLPAVVLGMSWAGLLGLLTFRGLWATFIHANVALPLGPLEHLFGSPRLHHRHHERRRDAGNYANLAPWIDRLFGTYRAPTSTPAPLGVDEAWPRRYLALLVHPFSRRRSRHA